MYRRIRHSTFDQSMDSDYKLLNMETVKSGSEIQKFFDGTSIFITGATGFLGNVLLDKLIRSCPGIKMIYILVREKKGNDVNERLKTIFGDVVFDRLRQECPDYRQKISTLVGDCLQPNAGLSDEDKQILVDKVDIIFHAAATVRFDAYLKHAVNINIRATRDLIEIAKKMTHLKAFVHVSTAFSNCAERKFVEEIFYDPPITPEGMITMVDVLNDDILNKITPSIIGPWPNTYAFTKAVAENVIKSNAEGLPITVVRPAIVIATAKEPIPGWINNYYGPTGVVAGAGLGLLRTMHADGECLSDLVPCDSVANVTIAAAWNIGRKCISANNNNGTGNNEDLKDGKIKSRCNVPIYNYVSSNANPLKWKDFMTYNEMAEPDIPSLLAIWIYGLTLNKYKFVHQIYCIFLHLVPAFIVDTCARILGKEPKLWAAYEKIHKFSDVISYFSTKQWKFVDNNVRNLIDNMTETDKELFDFDLKNLDWKEYFYYHIRGLRVYLIKDALDTVPKAKVKRRRLMIAHYTLVTLFWCLMLYIAFTLSKSIFGSRFM